MNKRVSRLRKESFETPVTLSTERAELMTAFYRENIGKYSVPVMRAKAPTVPSGRRPLVISNSSVDMTRSTPIGKRIPARGRESRAVARSISCGSFGGQES